MFSTLTTRDFIIKFINKCSIVRPSRLDKTIRALINTYNNKGIEYLVEYLNKIRVIYYLKRLDYYNPSLSINYKSKAYLSLLKSNTNIK